jgi:hypothetical protein
MLLKDYFHSFRFTRELRVICRKIRLLGCAYITVHPPSISHVGLFPSGVEIHATDKQSIKSIHAVAL